MSDYTLRSDTRETLDAHLAVPDIDGLEWSIGRWVFLASIGVRGAPQDRTHLHAGLERVKKAAENLRDALAESYGGDSVGGALDMYQLAKGRMGPLPSDEETRQFWKGRNAPLAVQESIGGLNTLTVRSMLGVKLLRDGQRASSHVAADLADDAAALLALDGWGGRPPDAGRRLLVGLIVEHLVAGGIPPTRSRDADPTPLERCLRAVLEDVRGHVSDLYVPGDLAGLIRQAIGED